MTGTTRTALLLAAWASLSTFSGSGSPLLAAAWTNIGPPTPAIEGPVAVHPASGRVYIGTLGGGVLKSTDGGGTFSPANDGLTGLELAVSSLAMDPTNPDVVVVTATDGGISRTVDGGASWQPTSEVGTNVVFVTVDPLDTRVWYAGYGVGGGAAIRKSVDGGATWAASDAGIPPTTIWSIAVDPVRPGVLYAGSGDAGAFKSVDAGASWTPLPLPPVVWSIAIDPANPDVVYAGTNGDGVYRSTDAGAIFSRAGSPDGGVVLALAVAPAAPGRVWAGSASGGLAYSDDHGATWERSSLRTGLVLSLSATADGGVWAGTGSDGVHVHRPPGGSPGGIPQFRPVAREALSSISAQNAFAVSIDPLDSKHLLLGTNDGGLLGSRDGGATWRDAGKGLLSRAARRAVFDPTRAGRVLVGSFSGGGLYSSANGGVGWARHVFGSAGVYVWCVAVDPASGATWAGTRGEGAWRSANDGPAFARVDALPLLQVRTIVFDPTRPGRIYAGGNSGLWRSLDGGASFQKVAAPNTISITVDPANPDTLYAATQTAGVLKSVDGGATFAPSNSGLTFLRMSRAGQVAIDPSNPSTLYVSTEGGGVFLSEDAGATWRPINDGFTDLTFFGLTLDARNPNVLYAAGPRGVFRTVTGGR